MSSIGKDVAAPPSGGDEVGIASAIEAFKEGRFAALVKSRGKFLQVTKKRRAASLRTTENVLYPVFSAHLHLLLFDHIGAVKCLWRFLDESFRSEQVEHQRTIVRKSCDRLSREMTRAKRLPLREKSADVIVRGLERGGKDAQAWNDQRLYAELFAGTRSQFLTGLLYSHLGNLAYRVRGFGAGEFLARRAADFLSARDAGLPVGYCSIAEAENCVWWARLSYRCGEIGQADELLRAVVERWESATNPSDGLDRVAAYALDLGAGLDWVRGLESARLKIFRSLSILERLNDPIHHANALYSCARIHASHTREGMGRTLILLDRAAEKFREYDHEAMAARVTVLKIQCLNKMHRTTEAEDLLNSLHPDEISSRDQRWFAKGEAALSRAWIAEEKARNGGSWDECFEACKFLVDESAKVPERLRLDGLVHAGLALIHSEDQTRREKGREYLNSVAQQSAARIKIKAAALLALAESYLGEHEQDIVKGREKWLEAVLLLVNVQSNFLERWKERLEPKLDSPLVLKIPPEMPLWSAVEKVKEKWLNYHDKRGDLSTQLIPRTTEHRLRIEIRLRKLRRGDKAAAP